MKLINLTQGKVAKVDNEDFERVNAFNWYYSKYAYHDDRYKNNKTLSMHRFVLNLEDSSVDVDHIDGDPLNNQKNNLRIATDSLNIANQTKTNKRNTSGYRGVVYYKNNKNKWGAKIGYKGKTINLGVYATPEEAAHVFDKMAVELFGEFHGKLNFPDKLDKSNL